MKVLRRPLIIPSGGSFSPSDLANLSAWYKGDAITGLSDGDPVGTWEDSSAANNDATSGGSNRPTYKTSILDSKAVVRFDGTDDYLGIPAATSSARTIVMVARKAGLSSSSKLLCGFAIGSQLYQNTGDGSGYNYYATEALGVQNIGGSPDSWNIVVLKYNSTSSADVYLNGGTATNFNPWDDFSSQTTIFMCAYSATNGFGDYDVAEWIVYDDAKSTGDLNDIGNYLADRFSLSWTDI